MRTGHRNPLFAPSRTWTRRDLIILAMFAAAGVILFMSGLPVRSLWGSEGRWAVVAREMLNSGNYFLPTINGTVYFDKPLLSYWMIIPFAWPQGVTETASRLPSALAGICSVLLLFALGKRLFGTRAGLVGAGLLLTSVMFGLWARTASAEILNLLSIWIMIWAFVAGGVEGRLKHLMLLYGVSAVSAFLKGPVAPAVAFSVMGFYSLVRFVLLLRTGKPSWDQGKEAFLAHFKWIASREGLISIGVALAVFSALLLLPVAATASWESAALMWRENVLRFIKPFDHVEPAYLYFEYVPLFFLPWTVLLFASLWESRNWAATWSNRWTLLSGLAIFLFFTASGSRRSYYILPLVPALALITGKAVSDWLGKPDPAGSRIFKGAVLVTSFLPGLTGIAAICAYFVKDIPHHWIQIVIGLLALTGSVVTTLLFLRDSKTYGMTLLFFLVFVLEVLGFTGGMALAEEMRTLRTFCRTAAAQIERLDDNRIALYPGGDSSLVFYLNRSRMKSLKNPEEVRNFWKEYPDGALIGESKTIESLQNYPDLGDVTVVLSETEGRHKKKGDRLILVRLSQEKGRESVK